MDVNTILSLHKSGFTPDQIATLVPFLTDSKHATESEPAPAPVSEPAPAPVSEPEHSDDMPKWAQSFLQTIQRAALLNAEQNNKPKSIDELANDALAAIISPYNKEGK